MPRRSSRRGKNTDALPRKRINIQDDDGWTHVTSRNGNIRRESQSAPKATAAPLLDELAPAEIPDGLTLKKIVEQYESHKQRWQESQTWKTLKTSIEENGYFGARSENAIVKNLVCIALGSPSGFLRGGLVDRRSVSLFQLAAFTSIRDLLTGSDDSSRIEKCYAQDPVFNTLDTELLESLNIEVLKDSSAFKLVNENTLLFAPGMERSHLLELLPLNPILFFGGPLDSSHSISAPEEESSILAEFTQKTQSIRLPEFEPNTAPFWGTSLFWRAS
ncbi:uncharacterized protein GIQ15_06708 [Arthroderma uncinatum]|uniref:uncharacterized protein n=1 Tax=Arthroderma uncinatum TaxID=74035 RepID=UPI00144AC5C2|nr:uncharacterized protein GIQ15_06708 [Arthroderma uncinatum]KAF3479732.1 hypothetical protein GIQ15_06708 [Arthroderma uncinatum]